MGLFLRLEPVAFLSITSERDCGYIKSIFKEGELEPNQTVAKNATVQAKGNKMVRRTIEFYNLDVIISGGYRVKSVVGTRFRQWATEWLAE